MAESAMCRVAGQVAVGLAFSALVVATGVGGAEAFSASDATVKEILAGA